MRSKSIFDRAAGRRFGFESLIFLLTYFNVLHIINEYIAKTKKRNIRDVSFSESCREVRGSSVNPELASESFC